MRFGPVPTTDAEGRILGHNVFTADGRRLLRKGRSITTEDISKLLELGRTVVYAATLEEGDVLEDSAALRVTQAVAGPGVRLSGPATGRVNLHAAVRGVVRLDEAALLELNSCEGITLATLRNHLAVQAGKTVATTKVLPYAVPESVVQAAEAIGRRSGGILTVTELLPRAVGLIVNGTAATRERTLSSFSTALSRRLERLGSRLERLDFVAHSEASDSAHLAAAIRAQAAGGLELIVLAGETAIQDRFDLAPRAVAEAGGEIVCFGAPVDPGNLLMLAYLGDLPILGAPGCARSPKINIVDKVLPRLLLGERLSRRDIVAMGHGGLLEDVPERPMPRSHI